MSFRFKDLSFRTRMYLLFGIFLLGLACTHVGYSLALREIRVNGPVYNRIVQGKDLVADILPPPYYIIESYLLVQQIVAEKDPVQQKTLQNRFEQLHAEYNQRQGVWIKDLPAGDLQRALTVEAFLPAQDFYQAVETRLFPALGGSASLDPILAEIRKYYDLHRKGIDKGTLLANQRIAEDVQLADQALTRTVTNQAALGLIVLTLLVVVATIVIRGILVPTNLLIERVSDMSSGAADLTKRVPVDSKDEIGHVATLFNSVVQRIHDLIARVRVATIQLNATATEIAAAAGEQNSTVQSFNASTTQIAASVKEISATGQELLNTINEVDARAREASQLAGSGQSGLAQMQNTMQLLSEATGSISSKLGIIREKAGGIDTVVATITKVADQTNLLSINAAIEAEKAGESGRGFLVVAREIRRLADQTAVATLDIDQMVRQMQDAVSAGVMEMDRFSERVRSCIGQVHEIGDQMGQIIGQVQSLSSRFDSVTEGMRQQTEGARHIDDAMLNLTSGVREVSASVREFAAAADNLREAAQVLQRDVGQFTVSN